MTIRLGLMGFGRIGRNMFRALHGRNDFQVVAISDVANHKNLEYLVRYDTQLGRFPYSVALEEKGEGRSVLYCGGREIQMYSGRGPGDVDWSETGVDFVVEATSQERSTEDMRKHIRSGARRVLLCANSEDTPDSTIVMGVNDNELRPEHEVVSCGSVTASCAAPVIKLIHDAFGIDRMFLTAIHAYTNTQRLADVPAEDLRLGRAASENIIPTSTTSIGALTRIMPQLKGKISGMALKVPVANGSLVDMTFFTEKDVSISAVNHVMSTGASMHYPSSVEVVNDPIVSSDVLQSPYSCTFDSLATTTLGTHMLKTIAWFDSGWGYVHRVIEVMQRLHDMEKERVQP